MLHQENLSFDACLMLFSRKVKGKDQHVRHLAPNPSFAPGLLCFLGEDWPSFRTGVIEGYGHDGAVIVALAAF